MKQKAIIVDLDGTLCQTTDRERFIETGEWDRFHEGAAQEEPNQWCLELIHAMKGTHMLLFVTGRPSTYQEDTDHWLLTKCDLVPAEFELLMAPPGLVDMQYKPRVYEQYIKEKYDVVFCLDDRPRIVKMWRSLGLICLQPNFVDH